MIKQSPGCKIQEIPFKTRTSSQLKPSTCLLDPIPTKFSKENFECMEDDVLAIITQSLISGISPQELKTISVKNPI